MNINDIPNIYASNSSTKDRGKIFTNLDDVHGKVEIDFSPPNKESRNQHYSKKLKSSSRRSSKHSPQSKEDFAFKVEEILNDPKHSKLAIAERASKVEDRNKRVNFEEKDYGVEKSSAIVSVHAVPDEIYPQTMAHSAYKARDQEVDSSVSSDPSTHGLFKKARQFLDPSNFYRTIMYLFAERKLIVFFGIHFVSTMIVWSHFALIKYERQLESVPEEANRYTWKLVIPPLEFGSMHAILFQMALIPLTMSRFSIAALNESFLDTLIPLNRALRMHIHLGYTMISIVALATVFFFGFFGMLCSDGEEKFCFIFSSEIMLTGYSILVSLLIIGGTSYFRHHIPYELFYAVHHLVFIMYFITIAHTMDNDERSGRKVRSQTFKWFSSTLLFYFCDRAAMHLNHRYRTRVIGSSTVTGSNRSRMIILKVTRPVLFRFKPGQYAFIQIKGIDLHWHPFSIASGPDSSALEFYVEVFGENSWSEKLWKLLVEHKEGRKDAQLHVDVMGPYGTSLAKTENFSHALALGAGTGIVPILSLLKQHVRQILKYDAEAFFEDLQDRSEIIHRVEVEREKQKGSLAKKITHLCSDRHNVAGTRKDEIRRALRESMHGMETLDSWRDIQASRVMMRKEANRATRSLYGVVVLAMTPVIGVAVLAFTISWNTIPLENGLFLGMTESLQAFTYLFQAIFLVVSIFVWDATTIWSYIDFVFCLISPFADIYWFMAYSENGTLSGTEVTLSCIVSGYMTLRLWISAVHPRHRSWKNHMNERGGVATLDRLEIVWTSRSASQVSKILPDILHVWTSLVEAWGYENARKVCRISIHVTDNDKKACDLLRTEMEDISLEVIFDRLNIPRWIENHTVDMIESKTHSYSVLAFCGSPEFASEVHSHKISNDMLTAITGHKQHQMEFVSESYGGQKKKKQGAANRKIMDVSMGGDNSVSAKGTANGIDDPEVFEVSLREMAHRFRRTGQEDRDRV